MSNDSLMCFFDESMALVDKQFYKWYKIAFDRMAFITDELEFCIMYSGEDFSLLLRLCLIKSLTNPYYKTNKKYIL